MARSRPDRVAAWAFVLGIFLILLAATTSRGEAVAPGSRRHRPRPHRRRTPPPTTELGERVLREGSSGLRCPHFAGNSPGPRLWPLKLTGVFDASRLPP